ncbi:hypothetical protein [Pseudonocardia phyllosphaerae]|uniref:hypothetical protein n=1 Tax=Pseudonocardia phyllosphaerae TaxID=3390502 RepID=UPI0039790A31
MSSPEAERRLRQQGADVDALYEISARIEGKVDGVDAKVGDLDTKIDQLTDSTNAQFGTQIARLDALEQRTDARFDVLEHSNEQTQALLAEILERIKRA